MKKINLMLLIMFVPMFMFATSIVCIDNNWSQKGRSGISPKLTFVEKNDNVVLSARGIVKDAEIIVTRDDGTVLKRYSCSSVDTLVEVLSEDEIPQEGCYVKISQGDNYVLYFVTKE